MSVILDHMLKCKTMVVNERSAKHGFNLGLGSADHVALKSRISLSRSILAVQKFAFSFFFFLKKKQTLSPLFMDRVQLPQGYRATTRRPFTF